MKDEGGGRAVGPLVDAFVEQTGGSQWAGENGIEWLCLWMETSLLEEEAQL